MRWLRKEGHDGACTGGDQGFMASKSHSKSMEGLNKVSKGEKVETKNASKIDAPKQMLWFRSTSGDWWGWGRRRGRQTSASEKAARIALLKSCPWLDGNRVVGILGRLGIASTETFLRPYFDIEHAAQHESMLLNLGTLKYSINARYTCSFKCSKLSPPS